MHRVSGREGSTLVQGVCVSGWVMMTNQHLPTSCSTATCPLMVAGPPNSFIPSMDGWMDGWTIEWKQLWKEHPPLARTDSFPLQLMVSLQVRT